MSIPLRLSWKPKYPSGFSFEEIALLVRLDGEYRMPELELPRDQDVVRYPFDADCGKFIQISEFHLL